MGNKSGSEFGGIMIRTEKMVYYAGDVVKGIDDNIEIQEISIFTSLKKDITENQFNLEFSGKKNQIGQLDQVITKKLIMGKIYFIKTLLLFISF